MGPDSDAVRRALQARGCGYRSQTKRGGLADKREAAVLRRPLHSRALVDRGLAIVGVEWRQRVPGQRRGG